MANKSHSKTGQFPAKVAVKAKQRANFTFEEHNIGSCRLSSEDYLRRKETHMSDNKKEKKSEKTPGNI